MLLSLVVYCDGDVLERTLRRAACVPLSAPLPVADVPGNPNPNPGGDQTTLCRPRMWPLVRRSSLRSLKAKHGKRVVLIGLDGAGKTTVLRQLISRGAAPETLPTIGFTVQELVLDGLPLTVFDVGGQEKIRELWSQYCRAADGLVLVVDSGDPARFIDVRTELVKLLHGTAHLSHASVLVLANKQDQPQALSPADLAARLRLHEMEQRWHIEGTVGLDGTGIDDGFDWLMSRLSSHASRKRERWSVLSQADAYAPGPPLGTYRLRVPASRVGSVPEAQGGLPPGPHVLYVRGTRTSLGRWVRTAYRGNPGALARRLLRRGRLGAQCRAGREGCEGAPCAAVALAGTGGGGCGSGGGGEEEEVGWVGAAHWSRLALQPATRRPRAAAAPPAAQELETMRPCISPKSPLYLPYVSP